MSLHKRNDPDVIRDFLKKHKNDFYHPECYLGQEPNTYHKDWDKAEFRILIAGLWRYEDNRGNQTLSLLYQMINEHYGDRVICERAFMPNTESEYKLFRDHDIPIFSLESKHGMAEFDMVLTSLSFIPPWLNFPLMLEMSGIPVRWYEREPEHPTVMIGGSAMYGNFSLVYPVVDIVYLGDAEPGLFPVLDDYMKYRNVHRLQQEFDYLFVPHFYIPKYDEEKFLGWETVEHLPKKLKLIRQDKLDDAPALTKPIPSYTDCTMGLGEIELSRGCRASCAYCGIGWKYRPYRERSQKWYVSLMTENRKNSGTFKGVCPIATEFAYYTHKRGLFNDLCRLSATVDPLSMRIDAFSQDPEFATALAKTGMHNLAVGVEGISQRLRNKLMKGITEEEILSACEHAIMTRAFKKIKFFLISNIGETDKDYEEFYRLLKKINDMKQKYQSKIQIKVSWTPLFVEPCTPFQWFKPSIETRQPWKEISKRLDKLKVEYPRGGGGKNEENFLWVMQGMHLGDTRYAEAIVDTALEMKRPFYVSHAKSTKEVLTKHLEARGYDWSYLLRERAYTEVFPWDIADRGVSKQALSKLSQRLKEGEFDTKVVSLKPKLDRTPLIKPENYEELSQHWYIMGFKILEDCVPNTHLMAQIHRAAYLEGFPLAVNSLHFNGERANRNWYTGHDYVFMGALNWMRFEHLMSLNKHLNHIEFHTLIMNGGYKKPKFSKFFGEYEIETGMPRSELETYISEIESARKVEILAPETRYFSGERKKIFDLKVPGVFHDLHLSSGSLPLLRVKLYDKVGIRYFLTGLLAGASFKRILRYSIRKTGLYTERTSSSGIIMEQV